MLGPLLTPPNFFPFSSGFGWGCREEGRGQGGENEAQAGLCPNTTGKQVKFVLLRVLRAASVTRMGQVLSRGRSARVQSGMCEFLTSCGKEFKIQAWVILRVCLLKFGTVKQRKGSGWKKQDRSKSSEPRLGCLDSGKEVLVTEVSPD